MGAFETAFDFSGRTVLVTGGAAGIGRAMAEAFAARGASLSLIDRDEAVRETAGSLGERHLALVADVSSTDAVERAVAATVERFGGVDVLVNNAGIVRLDAAVDTSEADWDATMAVNLKAPFLVARAVGRAMIARGKGGRIVNMASQAAVVALDRHLAYCTSKAGILGLTRVLALEWARHGITVNAISPTVVETELGRKAWAGAVGEAMKRLIPTGRFAQPDEVAMAALYLASGAAAMVTGENLVIDGGYTVG